MIEDDEDDSAADSGGGLAVTRKPDGRKSPNRLPQEEKERLCVEYFWFRPQGDPTQKSKMQVFAKLHNISYDTLVIWRKQDWWKETTAALYEEELEILEQQRRHSMMINQAAMIAQERAVISVASKVVDKANDFIDRDIGGFSKDGTPLGLDPHGLQKLGSAILYAQRTAREAAGLTHTEKIKEAAAGKAQVAIQQNNHQSNDNTFVAATGGYGNAGDHPAEKTIFAALREARSAVRRGDVIDAETGETISMEAEQLEPIPRK